MRHRSHTSAVGAGGHVYKTSVSAWPTTDIQAAFPQCRLRHAALLWFPSSLFDAAVAGLVTAAEVTSTGMRGMFAPCGRSGRVQAH